MQNVTSFAQFTSRAGRGLASAYMGLRFTPLYVMSESTTLTAEDSLTQRVRQDIHARATRYIETRDRGFLPGEAAFMVYLAGHPLSRPVSRAVMVLRAPSPKSPNGVVEAIPFDRDLPYRRESIHNNLIDALLALGKRVTEYDAWVQL